MRGRALAAAVALLAFVPAAQAAVLAEVLAHKDEAEFRGGFQLLRLSASEDPEEPGQPWIALRARSIEAQQVNKTFLVAGVSVGTQVEPEEKWFDLGAAEGHLVATRGPYQFNLYTDQGILLVQASEGGLDSKSPVILEEGSLSDQGINPIPVGCGGPRPTAQEFCRVEREGPFLLHQTHASPARAVVEAAHAVLEVSGLDLAFAGQLRSLTLQSGRFSGDVQPGVGVVQTEKQVFVRYILEDVRLEVANDAGADALAWAATALGAHFNGGATFNAASGSLGEFAPEHGRLVAPAGSRLLLHPLAGGRLQADLDPASPAPSSTVTDPPAALASPLLAVVAVAALLALAVLLALRDRRPVTLPAMEAAIAAGEHRRAARIGSALLRRNPRQEDALLGRAIALTRLGRPERAAREVAGYLARASPADGSLHYILGLAYLQQGQVEPAKAALAEAVRRTPQLEPEVRSRLAGVQPAQPAAPTPSSLPSASEASGYA